MLVTITLTQAFLQSPRAKTLSVSEVARMTDEVAEATFRMLRWPETNGEPVCPRCQCRIVYPFIQRGRTLSKCKDCSHQFSVTSGTIFASRKLPIRDYLLAVALFVNDVKGHNAMHLSRELGVDYKTAFVLSHKLREAVGIELKDVVLSGVCEVDGAYVGGHVRKANRAEDRVDRRLVHTQSGKRQTIMAVRQRNGMVIPFVAKSEASHLDKVIALIEPASIVHSDEASAYDSLAAYFETMRINHKEAYSLDGACTNWVESFFSRMRRAERGIYHHISGRYLQNYLNELAWRENHRRVSNGRQFTMLTTSALAAPISREWAGYWQRRAA